MLNETQTELFYRDGRTFAGTLQQTEKGKPCISHVSKCSRCGGLGGSDKWAFTGWTCFQCGGSGKGPVVVDRLYTAEQLARMNATRDKKAAKKAAAAAQAAVEREAVLAAGRGTFKMNNSILFARAAELNDSFINEMVEQCIARVRISVPQIELIERKIAETARRTATQYVGTIGERREFTCTLLSFRVFDGKFGRSYLHIMRDSSGNTIKYMGSAVLADVRWEDDSAIWDKAAAFTFTATVKEHTEYNGELQTAVARPKEAK